MDFGASTSGFKARLCHLIFYYLESNAVILHKFWRPQLTLPCFGLQYSISKKTRTTVSLSSMQGVFAESSLRKQAWRKPKEGRVGYLHQNIFTRKVTDIAFTSDFCNNYSHSASPASPFLTSPHPRPTRPCVPYLMSSSPFSRVHKSKVPTHPSRCIKKRDARAKMLFCLVKLLLFLILPMSPSPCPRPTFIHSPWVPTLTGPFPNGQANAGSRLGTKNALYYFAQSANSFY